MTVANRITVPELSNQSLLSDSWVFPPFFDTIRITFAHISLHAVRESFRANFQSIFLSEKRMCIKNLLDIVEWSAKNIVFTIFCDKSAPNPCLLMLALLYFDTPCCDFEGDSGGVLGRETSEKEGWRGRPAVRSESGSRPSRAHTAVEPQCGFSTLGMNARDLCPACLLMRWLWCLQVSVCASVKEVIEQTRREVDQKNPASPVLPNSLPPFLSENLTIALPDILDSRSFK